MGGHLITEIEMQCLDKFYHFIYDKGVNWSTRTKPYEINKPQCSLVQVNNKKEDVIFVIIITTIIITYWTAGFGGG